ncbi:MAG: DUF4245 domain-containing protein [Mycolicibacterium insubricum]
MSTQRPEPPAETEVVLPAPRPAKARLLQDGRDMFWSMAPLVIACIVLAGLLGQCSFQPTGPKAGPVPFYDAGAALHSDATTLGFPIRQPALPDGWQPNSGARDGIDGGRVDPVSGQRARALTSRVGYVTPRGTYLSLTQSNADEEKLVASLHADVYPTGTQDVAGTRWVVYQGAGTAEPVWTTRLQTPGAGSTQIALTGTGSTDEFRTLAEAVSTQSPLPAK